MSFGKFFAKSIILVFTAFLSSCGSGDKQDDPDPVPSPSIVKCLPTGRFSDDSTTWYNYHYDNLGRVDSATIKTGGNSISYITYNYGANNRLINQTQTYSNNNTAFYSTYSYNQLNKRNKFVVNSKVNGVFVPNRTNIYTYDPNGVLLRKDTENNLSGAPSTYTLYTINANKVSALTYSVSGVLELIEDYEFDGNKTPFIDELGTYFGEFDIPHNIVKYSYKLASGVINQRLSYTNVFTFNSDGYPIRRIETNGEGIVKAETYAYSCQ